jgi:hypothetical protein
MKTLKAVLFCFVFGLFCAACSNGPQVKVTPETGAVLVRISVMAGVAPVLNNNPKYIPAAEALGAGISGALIENMTITPELIAQYVTRVCRNHNVAESDIPLFVTLAETIYDAYVATYKPAVVNSADPTALLYVNAFREGLLSAAAIASAKR